MKKLTETSDLSLPKAPRNLIICADDYGLSPAVSSGIRELITQQRLTAVSVMTVMKSWPSEAPALKELNRFVSVGLHFTMTDQKPLSKLSNLAPQGKFPSIGSLIFKAYTGQLIDSEIREEFLRQLETFVVHTGRLPDFIDGHQHIHLLPVIRESILSYFNTEQKRSTCWIRNCYDDLSSLVIRPDPYKAIFISFLSRQLNELRNYHQIKSNTGFSGFYKGNFSQNFSKMLKNAKDHHLLMVHPGYIDDELKINDPLIHSRVEELNFMLSDTFQEELMKENFILSDSPGFL